MYGWSQSHFMQSLGWATLNSFWQMGLLWCGYLTVVSFFNLSPGRKYQMATGAVCLGFIWFCLTFLFFFQVNSLPTISFLEKRICGSDNILNILLISASIAYLTLLIFPSYKLYTNYRFIRKIKREGLEKADLNYRLFVQKIAGQLGIQKKVLVYLSDLIKSPVTIGYFKPIILLPVAAFNNLSTQQAEAVLLHELSHIRRYDYLVNLIINIVHTFLYFNPFVRQFVRTIEEERENCCDQMVIQYGYNKVSYASALLSLEKIASQHVLVMGAAGKKYLLNRIERIIGKESKTSFKLNHFTGLVAAFFCIIVFNSILIIKEEKRSNFSIAYNDVINPFHLFDNSESKELTSPSARTQLTLAATRPASSNKRSATAKGLQAVFPELAPAVNPAGMVKVGYDEIDGSLTQEQKDEVKSTIDATKKVVDNLQWEEVEKYIGDAMTRQEKLEAKQDYLKEMNEVMNWKNIENNLKAKYQEVDWIKLNSNLDNALNIIHLDSIQQAYTVIASQLDKSNAEISNNKASVCPLPDESLVDLKKASVHVHDVIKQIKALKAKKVIVKL